MSKIASSQNIQITSLISQLIQKPTLSKENYKSEINLKNLIPVHNTTISNNEIIEEKNKKKNTRMNSTNSSGSYGPTLKKILTEGDELMIQINEEQKKKLSILSNKNKNNKENVNTVRPSAKSQPKQRPMQMINRKLTHNNNNNSQVNQKKRQNSTKSTRTHISNNTKSFVEKQVSTDLNSFNSPKFNNLLKENNKKNIKSNSSSINTAKFVGNQSKKNFFQKENNDTMKSTEGIKIDKKNEKSEKSFERKIKLNGSSSKNSKSEEIEDKLEIFNNNDIFINKSTIEKNNENVKVFVNYEKDLKKIIEIFNEFIKRQKEKIQSNENDEPLTNYFEELFSVFELMANENPCFDELFNKIKDIFDLPLNLIFKKMMNLQNVIEEQQQKINDLEKVKKFKPNNTDRINEKCFSNNFTMRNDDLHLQNDKLKKSYSKLQMKYIESQQKEEKVMKLLYAIRQRGINIEDIYNENVKTPDDSITSFENTKYGNIENEIDFEELSYIKGR